MKQLVRPLMAIWLALFLAFGACSPSFAQSATQNPTTPAQTTVGTGTLPPISLGMAKYNYSRAPKIFPNLIAPYTGGNIPSPSLINSPKIEQLIRDGRLEISLQDAIELALQNSLDIEVARYNVWFADTDLLRTAGGGVGRGTAGASFPFSQANVPFLSFDPTVTGTVSFDSQVVPVNNPFLSGTGTAALVTGLGIHTNQYNFGVSDGFSPGTTVSVNWDNTRSSSSSPVNFFNPSVQSSLYVSISQQLLNGFGTFVNRRNIMISKNNRKIADLAFTQQAITTVTATITAYYELAYARENVKVQQQAVTVAEKLYNDNKKQLEIGTMAPLDVTRAESELATDRQNLIVAQTAQLQQQQTLRNAISKDPMATSLVNVEIITTDKPTPPAIVEAASFEEAVKEAFIKRPDLLEQEINLTNAGIDAKANKKALLPIATVIARYGSQGLAGNSPILTSTPAAGGQIVDASGTPVTVIGAGGTPVAVFEPTTTTTVTGTKTGGLGDAQSQIFHNQFPDYLLALNLNIPIRNRVAQADYQRAVLTQRQNEAQLQQLRNAAILDVRNTYIALVQNRARVEAAGKARELQQQTFDAEQKKYQLGASTVYNVILTQRDLITAQGTELRALADLVEAKANYERALGRTLEVNNVTIAENGKGGAIEKDTLIPGTLNGQVVGTDKLFKKLDAQSAVSAGASAAPAAATASGQK
ncbi:MAG TPA: TolC family protein [Candidatus Acidoferrum sp.]|nr:TolC family protein [Candidatus Acidoferrum sp.]